jgi:transcription antitermination factor NusA-like protein
MVAFPLEFFNFITDVQSIENKTKSRNKMKLLNNIKFTDIRGKIINTKDVKIKIIQKILNKKSIQFF